MERITSLYSMFIGDNILDAYYAYYGAFVDAEGHIGIKKVHCRKQYSPTYSERVSVASTNRLIIQSFNDIVVGSIHIHKGSKLSNRKYWSWEVTDAKAREFLQIISPYLKIKNLQADIVLALGRNKEKNCRKKLSSKDLELRENLYILLKRLHKIP